MMDPRKQEIIKFIGRKPEGANWRDLTTFLNKPKGRVIKIASEMRKQGMIEVHQDNRRIPGIPRGRTYWRVAQ